VKPMTDEISVLLVASDPLSVALVGEAFEEMAELRFRRGWRNFALTLADSIEDAEDFLGKRGVDAALLSLAGVSEALPVFRRLQNAAPSTPIVILADTPDEQTALDLVRAGAQDYLMSADIDCEPLAHAIRCAIVRNRLSEARERTSLVDGPTGLYNSRGFDHFSEHYAKLAARHGLSMLRVEAGLPEGADSDWAALRASEAFRSAFEPTDVVARTGPTSFSAVSLVSGADEAAATMNRLHAMLPAGTHLHAATLP
jgi:DNA-binding NarL/FixJ family response regulator